MGDNYQLTSTTIGCQYAGMAPRPVEDKDRATFDQLNQVRDAALEHARRARDLSRQRRTLINELVRAGYSQADIAREMGVTRQAVQKMLATG